MIRRRTFSQLALVACTVGLAPALACKPSTQGETQKFERNKIELAELTAKWPGFKAVGDAKLAAAEAAWAQANEVAGEEERAKAMEAANAAFDPLLNQLSQVQSKSENLRERIRKLRSIRLNTSKNRNRREDVIEDANTALDDVEDAMNGAAPTDEAAASALLEAQISTLISAASPVNRMIDKFKTKVGGRKKGKRKK